jgi:hypothetical protein
MIGKIERFCLFKFKLAVNSMYIRIRFDKKVKDLIYKILFNFFSFDLLLSLKMPFFIK